LVSKRRESIKRVKEAANKDAFDLWWEWAEKPPHSPLTISAEIHEAVMALPPNERHDRAKVNEAVREGLSASGLGKQASP
jgi:hypothetical protein